MAGFAGNSTQMEHSQVRGGQKDYGGSANAGHWQQVVTRSCIPDPSPTCFPFFLAGSKWGGWQCGGQSHQAHWRLSASLSLQLHTPCPPSQAPGAAPLPQARLGPQSCSIVPRQGTLLVGLRKWGFDPPAQEPSSPKQPGQKTEGLLKSPEF